MNSHQNFPLNIALSLRPGQLGFETEALLRIGGLTIENNLQIWCVGKKSKDQANPTEAAQPHSNR